MRKIIVSSLMSLDGVIEDPGGMAGVSYGGWANRFFAGDGAQRSLNRLLASEYFLCGRRTYEMFSKAWPHASGPYAERLNSMPKLVASSTLTEPLGWNATLLKGDAITALRKIKEADGGDIVMYGSVGLMHSLLANDLVDQLDAMVCPVVVGAGQRMFADGTGFELELTGHTELATGLVVLSYHPKPNGG
jgi:dihydrofolate reductase